MAAECLFDYGVSQKATPMDTNILTKALEEPEDSHLKSALVAKRVWVSAYGEPQGAVITAGNNGVFFAYSNDPRVGIRLTLDQWNRIVEFVDEQILESAPAILDKNWMPDWDSISPEFNFYAVDSNGRGFVYPDQPNNDSRWLLWGGGGHAVCAGEVVLPAGVSWKDTLCVRPGANHVRP